MLTSCKTDQQLIPDSIPDRYVALESEHGQLYRKQVQPLLDKRCIVCHGCYDAPCQLNLTSAQGIDRGANKQAIYNGMRLTADPLTRLFEDAHSIAEWREKEFFPVLSEKATEHPLQNSLIYQTLALKRQNPLDKIVKNNAIIPDELFDSSLKQENTCPDIDQFESYAASHPNRGMPYGLPDIESSEFNLLKQWLNNGAPLTGLPELDAVYQERIHTWEDFLNGDSNKQRLIARYIYEHLFLGHLYFEDLESNNSKVQAYFRIVRSTTPPGQAINIISTRRPYDDPQIDRVYYRLKRVKYSIVAKNHLPYALSDERLQRFKTLFFEETPYVVKVLPEYIPELAANPFKTFVDIPTAIRYRFMLEHAKFTINGFIKGAVCRGQVALNVINDHFWVVFVHPDLEALTDIDQFLIEQSGQLKLPPEQQSNTGILSHWTEYSTLQASYLKDKSTRLNKLLKDDAALNLDWVWDGDGHNQNAALTVFRHFDSATVVEGLVGQPPKTAWLIDYPILERIHYLLVAGFDVYGNIGHQLLTRLYMDFLRMESEFNFLALLPRETRAALRQHWYRGADETIKDYVYGHAYLNVEPEITYPDDVPAKDYLYEKLQRKLSGALSERYRLESNSVPEQHRQLLKKLHVIQGNSANLLPEMSLLMVLDNNRENKVYTLLRNSAHTHITSLLLEQTNRLPEEDYVTVIPGIAGAYPDALWQVESEALDDFVTKLTNLKNESDYRQLMYRFGIRRTHNEFWQYSDHLHQIFKQHEPVEYGVLDYNRIENR